MKRHIITNQPEARPHCNGSGIAQGVADATINISLSIGDINLRVIATAYQ